MPPRTAVQRELAGGWKRMMLPYLQDVADRVALEEHMRYASFAMLQGRDRRLRSEEEQLLPNVEPNHRPMLVRAAEMVAEVGLQDFASAWHAVEQTGGFLHPCEFEYDLV